MSTPKTLRGFDRLYAPLAARHSEVVHRTPKTDAEWIAYHRDLIAAKLALRDLFVDARRVVPIPAGGDYDTSITFAAFHGAIHDYERDVDDLKKLLATRQIDSGSTE
jgi:hypothetical protein